MDFLYAGEGHVGGRCRPVVNARLATLVLWIVNIATFRKHCLAKVALLRDFLGGYRGRAFPPGYWTTALQFHIPSTVPGYVNFCTGLVLACASGPRARQRGKWELR